MKKSYKIAITVIAAGIVMLAFLGIAWTKFNPIEYKVSHQCEVSNQFALKGYTIIPETGMEIAPNNYILIFLWSTSMCLKANLKKHYSNVNLCGHELEK